MQSVNWLDGLTVCWFVGWLVGWNNSLVSRPKRPCIFQDCSHMAIFVILIWYEGKVRRRKLNLAADLTNSFKQLIMEPPIQLVNLSLLW